MKIDFSNIDLEATPDVKDPFATTPKRPTSGNLQACYICALPFRVKPVSFYRKEYVLSICMGCAVRHIKPDR